MRASGEKRLVTKMSTKDEQKMDVLSLRKNSPRT